MSEPTLSFARVLVEELALIEERRRMIHERARLGDNAEPGAHRLTEAGRRRLAGIDPEGLPGQAYERFREDVRRAGEHGPENQDWLLAEARARALRTNLAGLAFSGGGIRSATFAVGILQGLAHLRLLRFFDVLSTVSGGGYAGGWLTAWIRREGDPLNVERQLNLSRIRQGEAFRAAGTRVAEVVDEEVATIPGRVYRALLGLMPSEPLLALWGSLKEDMRPIRGRIRARLADEPDEMSGAALGALDTQVRGVLDDERKMVARAALRRAAEAIAASPGVDRAAVRERVKEVILDVMGGGEIRGRLAAIMAPGPARARAVGLAEVVDEEPEPIRHLRRYSSYLNPRPGPLSTDTWTLVAIYARNVLINLLLLLPLVLCAVLLVRGVIWGYDRFAAGPWVALNPRVGGRAYPLRVPTLGVFGLGALAALVSLAANAVAIVALRNRRRGWHGTDARLVWYVVALPLLAGSVLMMMAYQPFLDWARGLLMCWVGGGQPWDSSYLGWMNIKWHMVALGVPMLWISLAVTLYGIGIRSDAGRPARATAVECLVWALVTLGAATWLAAKLPGSLLPGWSARLGASACLAALILDVVQRGGILRVPFASATAGAVAGVFITLIEAMLRGTLAGGQPWLRAMGGPPMLLLTAFVTIAALIALRGPDASESEREWWGRLGAMLLLGALGWTVVVGVIVYGPAVLLGGHQLLAAALASGWAATTIAGVLAGKSGATSGDGGDRRLEWIAMVAPPVFLVGLLAIAATLAALLLGAAYPERADDLAAIRIQPTFGRALAVYLAAVRGTSGEAIGFLFLGSLGIAVISTGLVNVNAFSLNAMYANRLTRAFLGASRRGEEWRARWGGGRRDRRARSGAPTGAIGSTRDPNPVTGFDPDDDLELSELRIGAGDGSGRYWGPHVVFNTAMNLVGGGELAWRDRKAESFMLTPMHCGARSTGYARTPRGSAMRLSVGRALSVSGAAVDPNMNFHQSPSVTALLTIFNARLGVWIQNPDPARWLPWWRGPWDAGSATFGGLLLKELIGRTDELDEYVHISDGGHFDNLGVYELLKRRCRYIVAIDATENPRATSDNLGILVRLCRVDLGLRIELDTAPLKVVGPDGASRAHVVVGRVRYDDVDHGQTPGMLVYIKSTLTGDEPPDVRQYADLHPEFPRQLTLTDQSFDEEQFESYRSLGDHVARNVFEAAARSIFEESGGDGEAWWGGERSAPDARSAFIQGHRKIFGALRNRWTEAPPRQDERHAESIRAWSALHRDLRGRPELARLSRDFYPELAILDDPHDGPRRRAELHTLEQVVQFMEDGWIGLGLKGRDDATIDRGWLNAFRRLAGSASFRLFWPLLRAQCSADFVRFCERRLHAGRERPALAAIGDDEPAVAALGAEFAREWPRAVGRAEGVETLAEAGRRYFWDRINHASIPAKGGLPAIRSAWLIRTGPIESEPAREPGFEFPLGLLVVFPAGLFGPPAPLAGVAEGVAERHELLFWVRPAHRSAGLGEQIFRCEEIDRLQRRLDRGPSSLMVRYPDIDGADDEERDRVRWLSFFTLFGFAPDRRDPLLPDRAWVLYKRFPEAPH